MNRIKKLFENKWFQLCFVLAVNLLLFWLVNSMFVSRFDTNDDYRMRLLVSGDYTGTPNSSAVFMGLPIGSLLAALYTLDRFFPWYGLFMTGCLYISSSYFFYQILQVEGWTKRLAGSGLYFVFFLYFVLKQLILPTFTVISAFMGFASVIAFAKAMDLFFGDENESAPVWKKIFVIFQFLFFFIVSYFIRSQILLMVLPVLVFVAVVKLVKKKKISYKKLAVLFLPFIAVVAVCMQITQIPMHNPEYRSFREYTKARSNLYDYYPIPEYEGNEEFYDGIAVSPELLSVIKTRTLDVDQVLKKETYDAIADYSKTVSTQNLKQRIKDSILMPVDFVFNHKALLGVSLAMILLTVMCLMYLGGSDQEARMYLLGACGYMLLVPMMLQFRGRLMDRVVETVFLLGSSLLYLAYLQPDLRFKSVSIKHSTLASKFELLLVLAVCFTVGTTSYLSLKDGIRGKANAIETTSNRLEVLKEYAEEHPDNLYFYNSLDFIGASARTWDIPDGKVLNIESLGNWNMKSPAYYERNRLFGFESAEEALTTSDHVYYAQLGDRATALSQLLEDKYDETLELVDSLDNPYGEPVNIYKVNKTQKDE